jgi:hypothetical protein
MPETSKREFTKIQRKTTGLEIAERIARSSVGLRATKVWTLKGSTPSEAEKEAAHGVRARIVKKPATRDSFTPTIGTKKDGRWLMFVHRTVTT